MPEQLSNYYLTQGVLGASVVALVIALIFVVRWVMKLIDKLDAEKDARRTEVVATLDKVSGILEANTQSNLILAEKIEAGKTRRRS